MNHIIFMSSGIVPISISPFQDLWTMLDSKIRSKKFLTNKLLLGKRTGALNLSKRSICSRSGFSNSKLQSSCYLDSFCLLFLISLPLTSKFHKNSFPSEKTSQSKLFSILKKEKLRISSRIPNLTVAPKPVASQAHQHSSVWCLLV